MFYKKKIKDILVYSLEEKYQLKRIKYKIVKYCTYTGHTE